MGLGKFVCPIDVRSERPRAGGMAALRAWQWRTLQSGKCPCCTRPSERVSAAAYRPGMSDSVLAFSCINRPGCGLWMPDPAKVE